MIQVRNILNITDYRFNGIFYWQDERVALFPFVKTLYFIAISNYRIRKRGFYLLSKRFLSFL